MEKLIDRNNYMLLKSYLESLREDGRISDSSITRYGFYLRHVLLWAMDTSLDQAHNIRPSLLNYLDDLESEKGKPLAAETRKKITENAHKFFEWCKMEYGKQFYELPTAWIQKLKFQRKNGLNSQKEPEFMVLEDVIRLVNVPGEKSDLAHWRDCAMAARLFLTGERASAAVTSPISAIDFDKLALKQWPELGVKTKNSKRATTFLINIPEILEVARSWDKYVRANLPPEAPWYASINSQWGEQTLTADPPGSNRNIALNKRLRRLFAQAGLPFNSAHKFRHGHAAYGLLRCQTMADYKALSLNLMHESLEITDKIYVHLQMEDMRNRITRLASKQTGMPDGELEKFLLDVSRNDIPEAIQILARRMGN
jgi:integrase